MGVHLREVSRSRNYGLCDGANCRARNPDRRAMGTDAGRGQQYRVAQRMPQCRLQAIPGAERAMAITPATAKLLALAERCTLFVRGRPGRSLTADILSRPWRGSARKIFDR